MLLSALRAHNRVILEIFSFIFGFWFLAVRYVQACHLAAAKHDKAVDEATAAGTPLHAIFT